MLAQDQEFCRDQYVGSAACVELLSDAVEYTNSMEPAVVACSKSLNTTHIDTRAYNIVRVVAKSHMTTSHSYIDYTSLLHFFLHTASYIFCTRK